VKAKSTFELALGCTFLSSVNERSFLVKIHHGSRDKTLSHYAGSLDGSMENRTARTIAVLQVVINRT